MKSLQTIHKFCLKQNLEVQTCRAFIGAGLLLARSYIVDCGIAVSNTITLLEGAHYVERPVPKKKMTSISATHALSYAGASYNAFTEQYKGAKLLSELALARKKKTEAQKTAQSVKLTERFSTPADRGTEKIITKTSIPYNSSEDVRLVKFMLIRKHTKTPGVKQKHSYMSKARWVDTSFLAKIQKYPEGNKDLIAVRATKDRTPLNKTSKLPFKFKASLSGSIPRRFHTDLPSDPYSLGEGYPSKKLSLERDGSPMHGCPNWGFPGAGYTQLIEKRKKSYLTNRVWPTLYVKECAMGKNIESCVQDVLAFVEGAT